jgi:hypothetical protein
LRPSHRLTLASLSSAQIPLSPKPFNLLLKLLHHSMVLLHILAKLPLNFCLDF